MTVLLSVPLSGGKKYRKYTDVPIFCLQHPILHFLPFSVVVHVVISGFLPTYKINLFLIANQAHFHFLTMSNSILFYVGTNIFRIFNGKESFVKKRFEYYSGTCRICKLANYCCRKKTDFCFFFAKMCSNCMFYSIPS